MFQQLIQSALEGTGKVQPAELRKILIITFLLSLILSATQIIADSVINDDGILYLQTAYFIQQGDWAVASQLYNWLTYPFLKPHQFFR
jgi:hypothetical protein